MIVRVTKTWETTEDIEVPEDMTKDQIIEFLDPLVPGLANNHTAAIWQWTNLTHENGDDIHTYA